MAIPASKNPFHNIPRRKLEDALADIKRVHSKDGVLTLDGVALTTAFQRYYDSNVPVDYWYRDMHEFIGPDTLKAYYTDVTSDVETSFKEGKKARFSGKHGIGKTMTCACILKRVCEKANYTGLYVNLVDIIHVMLTSSSEVKVAAREILLSVDFLVIDELDTRFMGTENAADLFGRILEPIMRTRIQNRMPLFFCTNSIKVEGSFSGPLQASMESLMSVVSLVPVIGGSDVRKKVGKGEI